MYAVFSVTTVITDSWYTENTTSPSIWLIRLYYTYIQFIANKNIQIVLVLTIIKHTKYTKKIHITNYNKL